VDRASGQGVPYGRWRRLSLCRFQYQHFLFLTRHNETLRPGETDQVSQLDLDPYSHKNELILSIILILYTYAQCCEGKMNRSPAEY